MFFGFDLSDFCSGGWFVLAGKKGEWGQFKIPAIPWFRLNFLLFYCPGGEDPWLRRRERVLPLRAPLLLFRLRRKFVALGEHGRLIPISVNAVRIIY